MVVPHVPNMVIQCQTIKKLWAGNESAQTDGQIDGDRVIPIYPPELRLRGYNNLLVDVQVQIS